MVVFKVELSIFWSWIQIKIRTWKYRFPKYLKIFFFFFFFVLLFFFLLTIPCIACMPWRDWASSFRIFGLNKLSQNEFWSSKKHGHKLDDVWSHIPSKLNFLVTRVDARSWNVAFCYIFGRKPFRAACSQSRFWKLKVKSKNLMALRNLYPNMVMSGLELSIF